jgi:hypothetical protein
MINIDELCKNPKTGKDLRLEYPNDYNEIIEQNLDKTVNIGNQLITRVRSEFPNWKIQITSGLRPKGYCIKYGHSLKSVHPLGLAVDLWDPKQTISKFLYNDYARNGVNSIINQFPIRIEHYTCTASEKNIGDGWIHIDCAYDPNSVKKEYKLKIFPEKYNLVF